ncbi:tyrosine-type recombinase/integrase [Nitrosomonas marina]|uniref:Site-specific recombinase XerD n=1 Tax=Nitrosomonas marina TaxID=917 RepID=A0A1H8B5E0_9PROT|nr:integrase arm-type DNA-binding domain-containing protein [Nitrosomonas marina]SEM77509.1 protein of unknown function [Nitrosomonas marina]
MAKIKLTTGRIASFQCAEGKKQDFLWCSEVKGLAVRATASSDTKRYIYQSRLNGKTIRLTIGKVEVWSIPEAKTEARRLQILIDQGNDPREVKKEKAEKDEAAKLARVQEETRERLTFGEAWNEYLKARKAKWSESHYKDHMKMIRAAGDPYKRIDKLTIPGLLTPFLDMPLRDISKELLTTWADKESQQRPTQARLALRLLRAFFNWCSEHDLYSHIVQTNPTSNKAIRETLGKTMAKNDVLQREQLPAWFSAVRQLQNPVISAYLQTVLLTGARREEILQIKWEDIDFQWNSMTIRDKVDGLRVIPLTPYVSHCLASLPRRNQWVFSSPASASGRLSEPAAGHSKACAIAGIELTIHGLRRSFASLCEWVEMPAGIAAQIQGHKPQGVREKSYIRRPLDLLRKWHIKIEDWILEQAGIEFTPTKTNTGLRAII